MQTWNTDVDVPRADHTAPRELVASPASLPPPTDTSVADEEAYHQRLMSSITASFALNFLILWILLGTNITNMTWFTGETQRQPVKEPPKLVLMVKPPPPERHHPQTFLETDPDQAVNEKPKDADFYSEHNTAARQTTDPTGPTGDMPKADGKNTKTKATETVLLSKPSRPSPPTPEVPAQAATPPSPPQPESPPPAPAQPQTVAQQPPPSPRNDAQAEQPPVQPAPKPMPEVKTIGDLALLKPQIREIKPVQPKVNPADASDTPPQTQANTPQRPQPPQQANTPPPKPATAQTNPSAPRPPSPASAPPSSAREIPNSMSKLDGNVLRGQKLSLSSAESPFAAYDKKIFAKIGEWWQAQVRGKFYGETVGEVEVTFKLMSDGSISDLQVAKSTANSVLAGWCEQAIKASAPFPPFPESMKTAVGDFREGTITFAY